MEALYQAVWAQVFSLKWAASEVGPHERRVVASEAAHTAAREALVAFSHAKQDAAIEAWRAQS